MLTNGSSPLNTAFFPSGAGAATPSAAIRGIAQVLLAWERDAQAEGGEPVFDHALSPTTPTASRPTAELDALPWEHLPERQSGLTWRKSARCADVPAGEQGHRLLGDGHHPTPSFGGDHPGNRQPATPARQPGPPGTPVSAVAGHSNVPDDHTMGINDGRRRAIDTLERRFGKCHATTGTTPSRPRSPRCSPARSKISYIGLGMVFAQATPDTSAHPPPWRHAT